MNPFRDGYIYRLFCPVQWEGISKGEHVPYSPDDSHDGFFHLSTPDQVLETAWKHYADHARLLAVGCTKEAPGDILKWEESRGGQLFPHIYGDVLTEWFDHTVPLLRHKAGFAPSFGETNK